MTENQGFDDEIDILWYQSGAGKKETIKNIILLILCYVLIKNAKNNPKMPKHA